MHHSHSPITKWICMFHMTTFFMISGYLFNDKNIISFQDVFEYIKRKIRSLYLPYIIFNGVAIVTNNLFDNVCREHKHFLRKYHKSNSIYLYIFDRMDIYQIARVDTLRENKQCSIILRKVFAVHFTLAFLMHENSHICLYCHEPQR